MAKRQQQQRTLTLGSFSSASPAERVAAMRSVPEEVWEGLARSLGKVRQIVRAVRADPDALARWKQAVADAMAFDKFRRLLEDPEVKASPNVQRYFQQAIAEAEDLPWCAQLTPHLNQARARGEKAKKSATRRQRARELFATGRFGPKRSNEDAREKIAAELRREGLGNVGPDTVGRYLTASIKR